MTAQKTDNHNLSAKLALRRHFLKKYHADDPPRVLDCCQGSGLIWQQLREEFPVASYWGVDLKQKKGRLKIDSERILAQPGWNQNVIDIDTYGSPWKHWQALLAVVDHSVTVFLTLGQLTTGTVGSLGNSVLEALGLRSLSKLLPAGFHVKLRDRYISYCLHSGCVSGIMLAEAVEAVSDGNARYIGVRLEMKQPAGVDALAGQ